VSVSAAEPLLAPSLPDPASRWRKRLPSVVTGGTLLVLAAIATWYLSRPSVEGAWFARYRSTEGEAWIRMTIGAPSHGQVRGNGGWQTGRSSLPFTVSGLQTGGRVGLKLDWGRGSFATFQGEFTGRRTLEGMFYLGGDEQGSNIALRFVK